MQYSLWLIAGFSFPSYVAEYNKWSGGVHQEGDTCSHVQDSCGVEAEDEVTCTDCLSGSPSSGGSCQSVNGKGKRKKSKSKDKKVGRT